jgi:hypothetical protein
MGTMGSTMVDDKIRFALVETNVHTRWPCHVCGGCTEKVSVLCEVETEGDWKGLRVCETCLEAGQAKIDERLQAQIASLESQAAELRTLVGRLVVPSFEEWQKAIAADEDEMVTSMGDASAPCSASCVAPSEEGEVPGEEGTVPF